MEDTGLQLDKIILLKGQPESTEAIGGAITAGYTSNEFAEVGPVYVGLAPSAAKRILALCNEFGKLRALATKEDFIVPERISFYPFDLGVKVVLYNDWQVDNSPPSEWKPDFNTSELPISEENLPRIGQEFLTIESYGGVRIEITEKFTRTTVSVVLLEKSLQDVAAGPAPEHIQRQRLKP